MGVSDALGKRYDGDLAEALRLAKLALELHPELAVARQFIADIEGQRAPEVAPGTDAGADDRPRTLSRRGRDAVKAPPVAGAASAMPAASAAVPVLPPSPPPLPPEHAPAAPTPSGPWL